MLTTYAGHTWETRGPRPGDPSRAEALAELAGLSGLARSTSYGRQAEAALAVCDYRECVRCCWAAGEKASPERWL